jgi:conjugative relaxase-like TrwC/TraI family protein
MNLHKLTAGNGWRYYWVETASHDETRTTRDKLVDYYAASGNPPGEWVGHGIESLRLTGPVKEHQMEHLFGLGRHPDTGERLGQDYAIYRTEEERIEDRLADEPNADEERRSILIAEEQAKPTREAVAGWDLTFAPVKSVSILWGIADDRLRGVIEECHQQAWHDALSWIEDEVLYTRLGRNGIAHAAVDGFVAAAFMHRTSRSGDPHLHTHVVASNKVRTRDDGAWRTIDGKLLHDAKVAGSERYNSRIETLLADRLGLRFTDAAGGQREVAGIPEGLRRRFSARRLQVEARFADLASDYRARHVHEPPHDVEYRLAQQATLETRPRKKNGTTPIGERDEWRSTTEDEVGTSPEELIRTVLGQHQRRSSNEDDENLIDDIVTRTLQGVHERRAQWTVMHVRAEAERAVRDLDLPTADHTTLVDRVVDATLAHPTVIGLTPTSLIAEPGELRLPNGDPIWRTANTHRYTTTTILDAEAALVAAARSTGSPIVDEVAEACVLFELAAEGHELAVDQAAAIAQIGRSGRPVDLLIAPAGAGKSHTMRAMAAVWAADAGRVIGLAPTARAARGLAESADLHEIGAEAHTIDKWLLHTRRGD